jgi:hypothetical protein
MSCGKGVNVMILSYFLKKTILRSNCCIKQQYFKIKKLHFAPPQMFSQIF